MIELNHHHGAHARGREHETARCRGPAIGGSFIAHPISVAINDIRALPALPVSGRLATKVR